MSNLLKTLHIVEPTLADQTGHCYGYVRSLVRANKQFDLHVWFDRRGRALFQRENCEAHPYFSRRLRKLQKVFCFHKLLKQEVVIFVPTAGRIDLMYLDWLLGKNQYDQKVFLHFHQFNATPEKMKLLREIAKRHPEFVVIASTRKLIHIFKEAGFNCCEYVPCPGYEANVKSSTSDVYFEKIIYAGAARVDKGFPLVVDLAEYLTQQAIWLPMELQISPPYSGHYDLATKQALLKLQRLSNQYLTLHRQTLNRQAYQNLFNHAISLLIYDRNSYHNKFSGVAFDAFSSGCPVVTVTDTWAGEIVQKFNAGVTIQDRSPATVYAALNQIQKDYPHYHKNALQAGKVLQKAHDPANTLAVIEKFL